MTAPPILLRGEKVNLREKRLSDAPRDYAWRPDPELARLDAASPLRMSYADYLRIYEDELRFPTPWSRRLTIETIEGIQIGNCMYYDVDYVGRRTELGILIGDRDYWGRGYGTDAVTTLLDYIFDTTQMTRVYLHTLDWNVRAQKSFAKCGFVPVRRVRRSGKDFIFMEVGKEQRRLAARAKAAEVPNG